MEIFDEVLKKDEKIHQEVTPKVGIEIPLKEPDSFKHIFDLEEEEE